MVHGRHVVLIPDKNCQHLPWESLKCMRGHSVSRIPSYALLEERLGKSRETKISKCFYVLNPGGDLTRTQNEFQEMLDL